jgi:hypothetical protein
MSDSYLRLIATDPGWQPSTEAARQAVTAVTALVPGADAVEVEFFDEVTFIDQGANLERILCPACHQELDSDWWGEEMARSSSGEFGDQTFANLAVTTPCCSTQTNLNELLYEWPAGFARFEIAVLNPQRGWLEPHELAPVANALGHPVKQVMAHY